MHEREGRAWVTDMRMGQEPNYSFSFLVARREDERWLPLVPRNEGSRGNVRKGLSWVWQRMLGHDLPPPG